MKLSVLQDATADRGKLWGSPGLEFRAIELAGETGEAMEALKKHLRWQKGMAGGKDNLAAVKQEIADVIISAVLLANELFIDLDSVVPAKFNETSEKYNFPQRLEVPEPRVFPGFDDGNHLTNYANSL